MQKGTLFADFFTGSQKTVLFGILLPSRLRRATSLKEGGIGSLCRRLVQRRNDYSVCACYLAKQTSLFEGGVSEADGRSSPLRGRYRFALPPLSSASECVFRIRLFPIKTDPHGQRYRFALPPLGSTSECVFRIRLFSGKTDLPLLGRCQRS